MSLLSAAATDEDLDYIVALQHEIYSLRKQLLSPTQHIKVNAAHTAAVAQEFFWIPVAESPPPLGVKLLLINKDLGVASMGIYSKAHQWTHWQGLPKFKPN